MSDLNEWIKERRRIHDAATEGPWVYTVYGVEAPEPPNPEDRFDMMAEVIARTELKHEDTNAIVDAHNNLPALLAAVENVLELHQPEYLIRDGERIPANCTVCEPWTWPCKTVLAIEGASE